MYYKFGSLVKKGRKDKRCTICDQKINIGDSSLTIQDLETYYTTSIHIDCYNILIAEGYTSDESYHSLINVDEYDESTELYKLRQKHILKNKIETFLEMCNNE